MGSDECSVSYSRDKSVDYLVNQWNCGEALRACLKHNVVPLCYAVLCYVVLQALQEQGPAITAFFNDNSVVSRLKEVTNRVLIRE